MKTIKSIFLMLKKEKKLIVISSVLTCLGVICSLSIPVIAGKAIDYIAADNHQNNLTEILLAILVITLLMGVAQYLTGYTNNRLVAKSVEKLRNSAVRKISRIPLSYIDSHSLGDMISRIISDADQLSDGLLMGTTQLLNGVLSILGTLVLMLIINYKTAIAVILFTPVSLVIARFIASRTHDMFMKQSETRGKQTELIDESVNGKKVISSYSASDLFIRRFLDLNDNYCEHSLKAVFFSSITNPSTRFVNNMIYALVVLIGALSIINGSSLTIGELTCFLAYAAQYAKPFNEISGVIAELQNAIACAERLLEITYAEEESNDNSDKINNPDGNISFDNISFSYSENKDLIKGLCLDVKSGDKIAIVGPTGSGKTTIVNLLMRFYDPDSGKITFDGIDIKNISRNDLRANYGMVLQETWIKSGTVRENISFGKEDATDDEIIKAAKSAYAHSFIKKLPDGYNTLISDDTTLLSQGQKQLICLSRIMLSNPQIIILDEATSSIDARTELKIRKVFSEITKGRTSFIVAHRLNTIKNSDLILVMNNGKVVEQGTHEELLKNHGLYEKMYNSIIC